MEIYSFYNLFYQVIIRILSINNEPQFAVQYVPRVLIWSLIGGFVLWLALFILQGFGLYTMAKKRGMKNKGLAFVPFLNIWYMGKLTGDCSVFGQKVKRAGLYAMLAQIIVTVFAGLIIGAELFLYLNHGLPQTNTDSVLQLPYWPNLSGFSLIVSNFYDISGYIYSILQLVYELLMLILMIGLYKKYEPKNYMLFSFLGLFMPLSRYIVIFVLRNRKAVDYDEWMRARREEYMRRQQQYRNMYGNPYGTPNYPPYGNSNYPPYGNPYGQDPYNNPNGGQQTHRDTEEPFTEFSSSDKKADTGENNGGKNDPSTDEKDDFFN